VLKQFLMAVTAAMVLGAVSVGAAAADEGAASPVDRLHQHQGIGPGGVGMPGTHHHRPDLGGRHGHGRPPAY
jgi:hypothetical protein